MEQGQRQKDGQLRIVFMGTPDFAVESLRRIVDGGHRVVAVVTTPDKPKGRHHNTLTPSPVKVFARERGLPVMQPERLKDPAFIEQLRSCRADLQVVVAFRMLPEVVWGMPRLGTFNLHAALLPQYRGAAPINWAIINGEKKTGVTTFFIDRDIDTGVVIHREETPIGEEDDAGILHDRLKHMGAGLVERTVDDIKAGTVRPIPQGELAHSGILRNAPKLSRETCELRWGEHTVEEAHNLVRGLSPHPAAWTTLGGKQLKIYAAERCADPCDAAPGETDTDGKTYLRFACTDGWLSALSVQMEGKRRMPVADFLRGICTYQ